MLGVKSSVEYFIRDKDNIYFYDFYIRPLNLIIEYNGHHVHPSERSSEDWKHAYTKKSKEEVLEFDNRKRMLAEFKGKKVVYIWSDLSYNKNMHTLTKEFKKYGIFV